LSKQRMFLTALLLTAGAAATSSCDEKLSTLAGPTPNLAPTFATIQSEIFEKTDSAGRPACTNCHTANGRNPAGQLNLTNNVAYDSLVNAPVRGAGAPAGSIRVIPGDPDRSYLVKKLEGTSGIVGQRMPFNGGPFLTDGQMVILRRWIANGASR
jgi:hypothetical protein